jgi:hypothetical protein
MSYYNNQNSYAVNPYGQHAPPAPQHHEVDLDDYYGHNNASSQWDSRSAKSSHTMHSNYSTQPINKPYEQQPPMPAPYQQNQTIDYPPTHRVQFPGGFGGPQRTYTQESAGFSSAREKLMKRRVRCRSTCHSEIAYMLCSSFSLIYLILFCSPSAKCPCRTAIWLLMSRSRRTLSLHPRRARNSVKCGYVVVYISILEIRRPFDLPT